MTIVEQAENELRLLMLCKPSTARALIDDVKRLRAELAGKRTSQEVSTQMECPDCHAVTRWGRHLDLDCHTIATLRAELDAANALVKRHEAALDAVWGDAHNWEFTWKHDCGTGVRTFGINTRARFDQWVIRNGFDTPLAAIEAATKEQA